MTQIKTAKCTAMDCRKELPIGKLDKMGLCPSCLAWIKKEIEARKRK